ncbi:MAG: preprotein translocase subunit YajC [Armatimonadota bacterium]
MEWAELQKFLPGLIMLVVVTIIFWFVVIRPTKKSQEEHKELIKNLVPGDEVITVGGIYGRVLKVREDNFDLEVTKGIVLTFDRRAARKLQDED